MCRGVEVCRGLSSSVELSSCRAMSFVELLNSCLAVEPGNAYAYSFARSTLTLIGIPSSA